jgi:MYXO-CTERM domain-containing protein
VANYKKIFRTAAVLCGLMVAGVSLPAVAQTNDQGATTDGRDHDRGFPWGILGLLGLAGLMGRKRERDVVATRRV